jgi:hypothetical protein
VSDQTRFLREVYDLLKPGASLLLTEPVKHVARAEFDRTVCLAVKEGFSATGHPPIHLSYVIVLTKPRLG